MTITESKALSLVANAELVAKIPSLGHLHQAYLRTKAEISRKTGCGNCNLSEPEFVSLKEQSFNKIRTLPDEDIEKLKSHLVASKFVFYIVKDGNRQKVVR